MQFTIQCPNDGEVVVTMNNVENMVIRDKQHADITFRCPKCGTLVTMTAPVPAFLMSTMENLSRDLGIPLEDGKILFNTIIGPENPDGTRNPRANGQFDPEAFAAHMQEMFEQAGGDLMQPQRDMPVYQLKKLDEADLAHVDYFHKQLDSIETVDQMLKEMED